jgi:hypothetical protein
VIPRARARVWLLLYVCVCVCSSMCVYLVLIELRFINHMYLCAFVHMCPSSLPTRARVLIHCAGDGGSAAADSDTAHADRVGLGADALLRRHLLLCRHCAQEYSPECSTVVHAGRASVRVRVRMRAYLRARLHGLNDRVGLCAYTQGVSASTTQHCCSAPDPPRSSVASLPVVRLQDSPHVLRERSKRIATLRCRL